MRKRCRYSCQVTWRWRKTYTTRSDIRKELVEPRAECNTTPLHDQIDVQLITPIAGKYGGFIGWKDVLQAG